MDIDEKIIIGTATPDQQEAIKYKEGHTRLLAGPGTGKTFVLTRKVLWLVLKEGVAPEDILVLTFTRLAAAQLRDDLRKTLNPHNIKTPIVSTLHSFALKQILFNSNVIDELPQPIRIADDWEERNLIQEDLKILIKSTHIKEIQELINRLSADWEQLKVEESGWEDSFPNPHFLGALDDHKAVYGETMRAELVYKLKKSLGQNENFQLDNSYKYVLVDEYQDLNSCDLAVIRALSERGSTLFVVGDDDQSIYGFRFANPVGIRQFPEVYKDSKRLDLEVCYRCDKEIIKQAEFVADQDIHRLPKKTRPRDDAEDGIVKIICFKNQDEESKIIANKVRKLIDDGVLPEKIVILSRSEVILNPIKDFLIKLGVSVSGAIGDELEDTKEFRKIIAILRLLEDNNDSLSLRTMVNLENNNLGEKCVKAIWDSSNSKRIRFSEAIEQVRQNPKLLPAYGENIKSFADGLHLYLDSLKDLENVVDLITKVIIDYTDGAEELKDKIKNYFLKFFEEKSEITLKQILQNISVSSENIEQETEKKSVSVLTMHKAKGLTFDYCFIVGAEDEFLPGKNDGEFIGDERRLLYVSMTRAKHSLYISYCSKRTGSQKFYGRGGKETRNLTRFLSNSKIEIKKIL